MSSQPGRWNGHTEGGPNTRNTMTEGAYSKSHGVPKGKSKKSNFTSADLKSQYLNSGQKRKQEENKKVLSKNKKERRNLKNHISHAAIIEQILQGIQPKINPLDLRLPNEESTKFSNKRNGIIAGYAANTNQGIIRNYNEDRVSIILNIVRPKGKEHITKWPKCSFFAIYDGHGGNVCADFLKDNLHQFIVRQDCFPEDVKKAIRLGCKDAEQLFFDLSEAQCKKTGELDKSGSCAIAVLIVEKTAYVANVGDSRCILSKNKGNEIIPLSEDHRPDRDIEHERITKNGGHIYQTQSSQKVCDQNGNIKTETIVGPLRVFPGRLSVSRTFGDIEAKLEKYGGNPKVVIAEPEIDMFTIDETCDYFQLGCDGIFDKLTSEESARCIWETYNKHRMPTVHSQIGKGVELTIKKSAYFRSLDNITVVVVAFEGFSKLFSKPKTESESMNSTVKRDNSQLRSTDHIRKTTLKEDTNKLKKFHNDNIPRNKVPSLKSQFQDEVSTEGRTESEKRSESSLGRRNTSNDERTSLNGVRLYQVQKMNHSLKDARTDKITKTPNISKNSKIEGLTNFNNFSYNEQMSRTSKNRPGVIKMKNHGTRNTNMSGMNRLGASEKNPESLTDKFMRQSEEFGRKRPMMNSKSVSKTKNHRLDFGSLSINSRRKNKNRDLKEGLLSLSTTAKDSKNHHQSINPVRSLMDQNSVTKKRIMSGSKVNKSSTREKHSFNQNLDSKEDSYISTEAQFKKLSKSGKRVKSRKYTKLNKIPRIIASSKKPPIKSKVSMRRRKLGKSEHYTRINSEYSRIENTSKPPSSSLILGGERSINASSTRYRRATDSEERSKITPKMDSTSNSMSRMMRSSPKIHLKHHIHNTVSKSSQRKDPKYTSGLNSKLATHKYNENSSLPRDSSRNQKIDSILQKHVLKPIRTTSASRHGGSYQNSSAISSSLLNLG